MRKMYFLKNYGNTLKRVNSWTEADKDVFDAVIKEKAPPDFSSYSNNRNEYFFDNLSRGSLSRPMPSLV